MSERALREIYLKPFEIAVKKANPWIVMTSYNKVNGIETAESYELCTNILRGEWGFDGLVITDWFNDSTQYKEVLAGNDVKMRDGDAAGLVAAYQNGTLTREQLETSVERVLLLIMKTNAAERGWQAPESIEITSSETNRLLASDWHDRVGNSDAESCQDEGGGLNLMNIGDGSSISYFVNVEKAGAYTVTCRVATPNAGAAINFYVDGVKVGTATQPTSTGGWQKWKTTEAIEITLPEGEHVLKIEFKNQAINPNYFEFTFAR